MRYVLCSPSLGDQLFLVALINIILVFFLNEDIFVQLDELDELDRITHA